MDNLARNAMLAKQAGMSYGQWKAMQKPVKIEKKVPDGWLVCENCGKAFKPKTKRPQQFCEVECQKKAYSEKYKEKKRECARQYKARKRAERENNGVWTENGQAL